MNNRKYEMLQDQTIEWRGRTLYRIRALRDFGDVHAGDVGGYIECERNLSQDGNGMRLHHCREVSICQSRI